MADNRGQTSIVYVSLFVLLSVIFLGFVFTFSSDFKENSAEEITSYLAENIFARIEKASLELKALHNQTTAENLTKTISIPRRLGENTYQIIGRNNQILLVAAGQTNVYKTKTIYWQDIIFEGSADSQNSEISLKITNATDTTIRIS